MRRTIAYGLFERGTDGKWTQIHPNVVGRLEYMRQVCQSSLLAHALSGGEIPERRLRSLRITVEEAYKKLYKEE